MSGEGADLSLRGGERAFLKISLYGPDLFDSTKKLQTFELRLGNTHYTTRSSQKKTKKKKRGGKGGEEGQFALRNDDCYEIRDKQQKGGRDGNKRKVFAIPTEAPLRNVRGFCHRGVEG